MTEMLVLVDEQDQEVGVAEKIEVHQQGLLHRAFSVFVVRDMGYDVEILLQQRTPDKYHCGALWTNTCCSHPRINEHIVNAAERRLHEEMGMQIPLQRVAAFTYRAELTNGLIEHEYDHVIIGQYCNEIININPAEVQNYVWIGLNSLQESLRLKPEIYTPWLQPALTVLQTNVAAIL